MTLVRSELYRMATIRSSWVSIALFGFVAAAFGVLNPYWWALFAGIGAFGISVLTVTQHFQHRTAVLLYLARPKRFPVLFAQVLTTVAVVWVLTAVSGITVLLKSDGLPYRHTLTVVPIMAVFGAATASVVRRSSWLLFGFAVWFVLVEGLISQMKWPLPISSYLDAARGDPYGLEVFIVWAVAALAVAALTLSRDPTTD
jgi:ABC-2 type transport system ATP-binding protein